MRDLFALSSGQLLSKVVGFIAFAYLARTLDPQSYGAVEYAVGVAIVFAMIVGCGLGPIGVRELSQSRKDVVLLAATIPAARFVVAILAIPIMGLSAQLAGQSEETVRLVWLFAFSLLAVPFRQDWLLQGHEMMRATAAATVVRMSAFTLGVIALVHGSQDLLRVGLVELASVAIVSVYYLAVQRSRISPFRMRFDIGEIRRLIGQGYSVGFSQMVWAAIQYTPLFLVANLIGGEEIAWFAAPHRIVVSLLAFSWIYHFNLYPAMARRIDNGDGFGGLVNASFRVVAWGGVFLALVFSFIADPLLLAVYGDQFAPAAPALVVLIWVVPVTLLSGHAQWALIASGHQKHVLFGQIAGMCATIAAGVVLVPLYLSVGAAIAMLIATVVVWAYFHISAVLRIGTAPSILLSARPVILALLAGGSYLFVDSTNWWVALMGLGGYLLAAPLIDPALIPDLRRLVYAKSDFAPSSGGPAATDP